MNEIKNQMMCCTFARVYLVAFTTIESCNGWNIKNNDNDKDNNIFHVQFSIDTKENSINII